LAGGDAGDFERNYEERNACCTGAASADCGGYVVGPYAVCDPFLGAVDDVMISLADGGCLDVRYI
jgi:hypothetical protein